MSLSFSFQNRVYLYSKCLKKSLNIDIFSNSHFSICSEIQVMYQNLAKVVTEKARVKAIEKFKRESEFFLVEECLLDAAWDKDNDVVFQNDTDKYNPWKV